MTMDDGVFLDPLTWLDRVTRLLDGLGESDASPDRHIRTAYHLVRLAPDMLSTGLPEPMEEARVEAILADCDYESAVVTILGPNFAYAAAEARPSGDRSLAILAAWAGSFVRTTALAS